MRWKRANGIIFDSYKDSSYIILITKNKEFNFLKNTPLEHIVLVNDRDILVSFLKYVVANKKEIIYVKKTGTKDILAKAFGQVYDYTLVEYNSISEEFDSFLKITIEAKIKSIENEQSKKKVHKARKIEEDNDEEIDMSDVEDSS